MFDEFLEINGIGPFPIYRVWRKRPIRKDVRMLQMERIARVRHWLVTQWNANARMTVTERLELRQDRMFWKHTAMRVYGVTDQAVPKLLWPERPWRERRCIGWVCGKKVPANRLVCPWCGSWNGEREWRMQPLEFPAEYLKAIMGDW